MVHVLKFPTLVHGSYRQVCAKFKDFSRTSKSLSNSFQGLKLMKNTDLGDNGDISTGKLLISIKLLCLYLVQLQNMLHQIKAQQIYTDLCFHQQC